MKDPIKEKKRIKVNNQSLLKIRIVRHPIRKKLPLASMPLAQKFLILGKKDQKANY
jgi:hypothetical protein